MRSRNPVALLLLAFCAAAPVHATPYWIAWEGDDWPENQGWTRNVLAGGDQRTLANGMMTLDGLNTGPGFVWDGYEQSRPGAMDPGPGETFVLVWRVRIDAVTNGNWELGMFVYSDDAWAVSLHYATDQLWASQDGPDAVVPFDPGLFHAYELRTDDMRSYTLAIDGALVLSGVFEHRVSQSWLGWGDGGGGTRSVTVWDYVRYGVVPEPRGGLLLTCGAMWRVCAAQSRRVIRKGIEHV